MTLDFQTSAEYTKLGITKDDNGYDVVTLPAGSTVYRGDPFGFFTGLDANGQPKIEEGPSKVVPVFFGDKGLAGRYGVADEEDPRPRAKDPISSYKTKEDARLFVMSDSNFRTLAKAQKNEGDKTFIEKHYIEPKLGEEGAAKLQNLKGMAINKDTTAIQPFKPIKYRLYSNRKLAQLVCAAKFHGWIVFPMTLIQTVGDVVGLYDPEIMLCKWADTADRVRVPAAGFRRRYSRKYCKKTPCKRMGFSQRSSCRPYKNCFTRRADRKGSGTRR